jgi:ATPase subunit of ABC transporter with duplicated ATPase domains
VSSGGRVLFDELTLCLGADRVALVGRNGVGKSTLLRALAGELQPERGRVRAVTAAYYVPQLLPRAGAALSHGQERRALLERAFDASPGILLLDEPSEDLDDAAVRWLRGAIRRFAGCLVMASHDRRLLADFENFLVAGEMGSRLFTGDLDGLEESLERERVTAEQRYLSQLAHLESAQRHTLHVERRKARKKRHGRVSELDRATPRIRLNQKRSDAQVSHGRLAKLREQRLDSLRLWTKALRRSLAVDLDVAWTLPTLPEPPSEALWLREVAVQRGSRLLCESLSLVISRERVALVGPNGAGKTSLLDVALGRSAPSRGSARRDLARIGSIAQGAADWCATASLLELLLEQDPGLSAEQAARLLQAHKFPLLLAQRPLASLSPGERTRAALLALLQRRPAPELLVLDEPTFSLDLVGQRALVEVLRAWQGGLLIASHDRAFLQAIGVTQFVELGSASETGSPGAEPQRTNAATKSRSSGFR